MSNYQTNQKVLSIKEILDKDSEDESLKRYKESLGLLKAANIKSNDSRRIVIKAFGVEFSKKEHSTIIRKLELEEDIKKLKEDPISIKQGVFIRLVVTFRVNNEMVNLLKFHNTLKKGIISHTEEFVMGSYAASDTDIVYKTEYFEAPSGIFGRGIFNCSTKFMESNANLLEIQYKLKITKDWE